MGDVVYRLGVEGGVLQVRDLFVSLFGRLFVCLV